MAVTLKHFDADLDANDYDPLVFFSDVPKFKFDELSKNFVRDFFGANARKYGRMRPILKDGSYYEIFEILWDMEEAQDFLIPNFLIPEETLKVKDEKKAFKYFIRGEQQRSVNKDSALKYYNASIIFAPHPPVKADGKTFSAPDVNSGKRRRESVPGWGHYKTVSRVTMARAELLFEMGHYKASIEDIEFVLLQGCPASTEENLYCLKSIAYQRLLTAGGHRRYSYNSFSHKSAPPSPAREDNLYLTGASAAVELVHKDGEKRCLITNRNVSQGEVLIMEKSYCSTILPKHIRLFCMTCLKRTATPLPCPACTQVVFCSKACRREALLGLHWTECPVLPLINALNIEVRGILACRILFKTTFQKLKAMREEISEEQSKPAEIKGLTHDGSLRSDEYLTVYSMTGREEHSGTKKMERAVEAFVLLKLMIACQRFFVRADGTPYHPSRQDKLFVGSLLLHHLINLWVTADGYYEVEIMEADAMLNPMKVFAAGVFPVTNLVMAYGCYSPCAPFTHGPYLVTRATCAIPTGTILTCKYTLYVWQALKTKDDENFVSDLYGCNQDDEEELDEMPEDKLYLKCVRCPGKVDERCLSCGTEYNMVAAIPGMPGKFTYNFKEVMAKVYDLIENYRQTRDHIRETGITASVDIESICRLITFLDEHVHLPAMLHKDAQIMYILAMSHRTCSVIHDGIEAPGCPTS